MLYSETTGVRIPTERFCRAVRAACGEGICIYPKCGCGSVPLEIEKAIASWETLPDETNGDR